MASETRSGDRSLASPPTSPLRPWSRRRRRPSADLATTRDWDAVPGELVEKDERLGRETAYDVDKDVGHHLGLAVDAVEPRLHLLGRQLSERGAHHVRGALDDGQRVEQPMGNDGERGALGLVIGVGRRSCVSPHDKRDSTPRHAIPATPRDARTLSVPRRHPPGVVDGRVPALRVDRIAQAWPAPRSAPMVMSDSAAPSTVTRSRPSRVLTWRWSVGSAWVTRV